MRAHAYIHMHTQTITHKNTDKHTLKIKHAVWSLTCTRQNNSQFEGIWCGAEVVENNLAKLVGGRDNLPAVEYYLATTGLHAALMLNFTDYLFLWQKQFLCVIVEM